jgi:4'-phosphopantetheinyl transferase, N-terminal
MLSVPPRRTSRSVPFGIVEDVRIWQAWLDRDGWPEEDGLPADERRRAESIVIEGRRRRWVAARWALRTALGRRIGVDPAEVALEPGPGGKPRLSGNRALRFNLSHSGDLAVIAITVGREVGVDVERADTKRPEAYYRSWVRREARAKCAGAGILAPAPEEPIWVTDLDLGPGWAGALALEGQLGPRPAAGEVDEGVPGGLRPQVLAVVEEADRVAEVADVGKVLPGEPVGPLDV